MRFSIVVFVILLLLPKLGFSQCFTIETILADACGDPEGENEMVLLRINQTIDISNLSFDWPNNNFLGWCADPSLTQQLNQTISNNCGFLLEPLNGVIPANSKLLVVTSTNMLINANSFANLTDTIYILYQCAGNTAGHFSNTANSLRTLQVDYVGACISSQAVSYLGTDLIGGDGAAVYYDTQGNSTYFNTGCNAPVQTLNPFFYLPPKICNTKDTIFLASTLSTNATLGGTWSGDLDGNFYFVPQGKLGTFSITYSLIDSGGCIGNRDSTITFEVVNPGVGTDTITRCDSILQFGFWITNDTVIDIAIPNPNPNLCDSVLQRFYKIEKMSGSVNPDSIRLYSGESFTIDLESPYPFNYSFWNVQDDTCSAPCFTTEISPLESGYIYYQLINALNGCQTSLNTWVELVYLSELNIPTAFTPNGDGVNDLYKVYGKDLSYLNFEIFSRWGERVFHGTQISDAWDGNFNGKPLSSQLFLLHIKAVGKDGQSFEKTEKIKLIR